jgi:uncharacterized protein YjiS (DUF1127 family)
MTTLVANTFEIVGLHGIANFFKKLGAELKRRRRIRQTINELSRLTNHELNDIGLSRGDIWYVANQSYPKALSGEAVEANRNLRGWV